MAKIICGLSGAWVDQLTVNVFVCVCVISMHLVHGHNLQLNNNENENEIVDQLGLADLQKQMQIFCCVCRKQSETTKAPSKINQSRQKTNEKVNILCASGHTPVLPAAP